MPVKPVPMVKAFEAVAVTVIEPPKLTEDPLIVMALLSKDAFGIALKVFVAPLIDLFVRVCEAVFVVTVSDPTVADVMLNAPPVTVLPVKVSADGRLNTTAPDVGEAVISLAVPVTEDTPPITENSVTEVSCP